MTLASRYLHPRSRARHPVIRRWELKMGRPGVAMLACELQRDRNGLAFEPAVLRVLFLDRDGRDAEDPESESWERELDDWLLDQGVRAISHENEAVRFGFSLADRFSKAEDRFGDGYFNTVLATYLLSSELGRLAPVARLLTHLHENRPARAQAWRDCEQMIEAAIATVGEDLTRRLQYSDTDATEILGNALAYYLDERFSITTRRMLGFLE